MKAFLAVLLSLFIVTGDVSAFGYSAQSSVNTGIHAQDVHFLQEDTTADDTGKDTETETDMNSPQISAPSAILMEVSTGTVIYEKDADSSRPPASVTKVMTMLLIFDAIESGKIKLEDEVTTSEYAASMGGSQVFLEPGETQTVETMLKCISVASANDACVAFQNRRQRKYENFIDSDQCEIYPFKPCGLQPAGFCGRDAHRI